MALGNSGEQLYLQQGDGSCTCRASAQLVAANMAG